MATHKISVPHRKLQWGDLEVISEKHANLRSQLDKHKAKMIRLPSDIVADLELQVKVLSNIISEIREELIRRGK